MITDKGFNKFSIFSGLLEYQINSYEELLWT
jgi:hypothetical protein